MRLRVNCLTQAELGCFGLIMADTAPERVQMSSKRLFERSGILIALNGKRERNSQYEGHEHDDRTNEAADEIVLRDHQTDGQPIRLTTPLRCHAEKIPTDGPPGWEVPGELTPDSQSAPDTGWR